MIHLLLTASAWAAEVVWLAPPPADAVPAVAAQLGASGSGRSLVAFRSAALDPAPEDDAAYARLADTLAHVRAYETKLDGELLIMEELGAAVAGITICRSASDRSTLFAALAYQGFAVDRFFADTLGTDPRSEGYRIEVEGRPLVGPWADAAALDPAREVTPYEIAEAPQRVRFAEESTRLQAGLPGRLAVAIPTGAALTVDGRDVEVALGASVVVLPGRHLAHLTREGHVLARWDVRVAPGGKAELALPITDADFDAWVSGMRGQTAPALPAALDAAAAALGGEVAFVEGVPGPKGSTAFRGWMLRDGVFTPLTLEQAATARDPEEDSRPVSLEFGVAGGWLSTADFVLQDPQAVESTFGAVNAVAGTLAAGFSVDIGAARLGLGVDTAMTFGAVHVAKYGSRRTPLRVYPRLSVGVRWAQATLGYAFPHHPTGGLRATIPVGGPIELVGGAWVGLPGQRTREDDTVWQTSALYAAYAGIGVRPRL